jgi:hypothetical protein
VCDSPNIRLEWSASIALCSELARKVLNEIGAIGMEALEKGAKTLLVELLAVEIEEEGIGKDDEDATTNELVIDKTYVVAEMELLVGGVE